MKDPEETAKRIVERAREHIGVAHLVHQVAILMAQEARREAVMHAEEQQRMDRHSFWNEVIYYIRGVQE